MTKPRRYLTLLAVTGLAAGMTLISATPAFAVVPTLEVCSSCTYTTISAAVAAASNGDTIQVDAGTYPESVTIDKSLTLVGPNSTTSPNTPDPLVANTARVAEAIVKPAGAAGAHAFIVADGVTSVSISGFTVDLSSGVTDQRYFMMAGNQADLNLSLTHNIFEGASDTSVGYIVVKSALGNANVTVTDNRFTESGSSNGLRINNTTASGTTNLTVTNNVWLDNKGLALNNSYDTGATTGTISNNWIGNSTPGTSGVDNFGLRQGGMVLAGNYGGLQVTHNTFADIEDAVVSFWTGFSGTLAFTDNSIDGYSNVAGYAAIYVRPSGSGLVSDISSVTFVRNTFDNPTTGSRTLLNQTDTGNFAAADNWWGSESGPDTGQIVGPNVSILPWLAGPVNTSKQILGVTAHDGEVSLIDGAGTPTVTIPTGQVTGGGMAWFEYSPLSASDLPGAGSLPFGDVAIRIDIALKTSGMSVEGPFTVCVNGAAPQRLWHYEGSEWVDITNRGLGGQTVTPVSGKLCGMVSAFSPFALAGSGALASTGVSSALLLGGTLSGAVLLLLGIGAVVIRRRALARLR